MAVNWKRVRPTSLKHAMELCLKHAKEKKNLSVERVSELIGVPNHWTLYKWLSNGRMPAILIVVFENVCGIDLITQYQCYSKHKLLIDIPSGKKATESEINDLQSTIADAFSSLLQFYKDKNNADETIALLNSVISDIAFHKINVEKSIQPELPLFDGDNNAD